jgi:hypothetical protein
MVCHLPRRFSFIDFLAGRFGDAQRNRDILSENVKDCYQSALPDYHKVTVREKGSLSAQKNVPESRTV